MTKEQIVEKIKDCEATFERNRANIEKYSSAFKALNEENFRLQGEHRLLKSLLKEIEPEKEGAEGEKVEETAK